MGDAPEITVICQDCNGTGTKLDQHGNPGAECFICSGNGSFVVATIPTLEDLLDDIADIKSKLDDIWEKINE